MTLAFKTTILLAGKTVPTFKEIRLHQEIHSHHTLEARFPWQVFEKEVKELGDNSKEFLAETFSIQIISQFNNKEIGELVFKGVVTGVNLVKGANTQTGDEIVLIISSPEIITDGGSTFNCFHEMDIAAIVKQTLEGYQLKSEVNSTYSDKINYVVQYNESNFQFIQRLSEQYGQWLYYNGEELVFGKPDSKVTELHYKFDLTEYKINLIPQPLSATYFSNDYLRREIHKEIPNAPSMSGINSTVYKKSDDVFRGSTSVWANTNNDTAVNNILKHKAKVQQESLAINQVKITGSSKSPNVSVGRIVKVEGVKYRIVKVDHFLNRSGQYENRFEGVSANQNGYPKTNINSFPVSQSQIGIVADNADPEALGRIKVLLTWGEMNGGMTPWIRMATPHSGSDKGFYYIPEIGEEVIVDFEGGDAESPYVLGALWNGQNKPPAASSNQNNDIKTIQTRSGCFITFDDAQGSITLSDKSGSSIALDGSGNISITAASGEVSINGPKEVSLMSDDEVSLNGKKEVSLKSDNEVSLNGKLEVSIESAAEVNIKGKMTTLTGDIEVTVEGTKAKVDGTAMTEIKGGIVKMN